MKVIIFIGSLAIVIALLIPLYNKVSITESYFNLNNSPVWIDIVFILLGLSLVIPRCIALYTKWFIN